MTVMSQLVSSFTLCVQVYYPSPHEHYGSLSAMIFLSSLDVEVQRMKKAVESLMAANEEKVLLTSCDCVAPSDSALLLKTFYSLWFELSCPLQDRKIDELKQSLLRYKKVQDMVMSVQGKKG